MLLSSSSLTTKLCQYCFPRSIRSLSRQTSTTADPLNKQVLSSLDETTQILTITLNSPKTFNALTVSIGQDFQTLVHELNSKLFDGSLKANVLIITGKGKAFSAGGDLTWLRNLRHNPVHANAHAMYSFYKSFLCMRELLPIPIIAAVNGPAVGAGACLAIASDVIIAEKKAKIGFTFSKLGMHAGMGGSHFLPLRMGGHTGRCHELLYTGNILHAEECYEIGIVSRLADEGGALVEATRLAKEIAKRNPLAVRGMVRSMRMSEDQGLEAVLRREANEQALCYAKVDWGEGINALEEGREPHFQEWLEK